MLLLDSKQREIEGITVFPDHADPLQYYYLPLAPHLTTIRDQAAGNAEVPQFSLIRFRGEAGAGGFLNFDVNIGASDDKLETIKRQIQNEERLREMPRLAPVTTVSGTVKLLMLGRQSGDDPAVADAAADGGPKFVLKMDHHASPSLYGNNQAAFSIRLDQAGVTVIEKSLAGEIMPIAVVYSLNYLGLRPAYSVRLNIDWDRVQKHMDEKFAGGFLFSSFEIANTVDELEEERAIVLEADTFITEDEENQGILDRRDAALAQVRSMITEAFFTPSLPPYEPGKEEEWKEALRVASGVIGAIGAGPAGAATSSTFFSYANNNYKRVDKKMLNVNFSERVAIQRSIHPQGHLAGMFRLLRDTPLPRERFITDVDLDDPWFQKRRLNVVSRADFDTDAIGSINVQARYGDNPKNVLLGKASQTGTFEWMSVLDNGAMRRPVEVQYEVNFTGVDTTERPRKVVSERFTTEVENLEIDPRELYAISTVPIVAVNFPWAAYPMVEAHVRYQDEGSGLDQSEVFQLTEKAQDAQWRIFILDPRKREFSYRLVYRAADNRDLDAGWKTTDEEQISVRDPYPRKRVLDVVANVDWNQVDQVFVDLRYEDEANDIFEEASFNFAKGSTPQKFTVDMQDPELKQVFFKVTFLFVDGRMVEVPESMTLERRIVVRPDMKGRRVVEVRPPADFAAKHLKRATAEVRYEDFAAGLSFNDSFVFEDASARGYFEFDYVDEARDRYETRTTYLYDNGLEQGTDWQASEAAILQIKAP
ncbi:hypothetical protein [Iodidimonas sp. SYSU 1G8]|uniref:hypothetical protein n=1 Tax=Iodidimonas sp. SYSU 1G8 TaxID=3133967 RepID=UPI0031FED29B